MYPLKFKVKEFVFITHFWGMSGGVWETRYLYDVKQKQNLILLNKLLDIFLFLCNQVRMQTSSSAQHQSMVSNGGRTATNNYSMNKSASASSMKNNADDVLKDLETGLKKSTNYIEESHRRYQGPEGNQEWKEVRRGGDPGADYSLEQQVQHMIGGMMQILQIKHYH